MSSRKINVSIIVPVYNVEKYLDRCLNSLVNQTLDNIEIIVVNDGTKDHSQDIIDGYVKMHPTKVISLIKENGGLSDARNYGIAYAKGDYIGFVDSDDYVDIDMYAKLFHKAIEDFADIVVCGYYGINEEKGSFQHFQKGNVSEFGKSLNENPNLLYLNSTYAWNKLYKKDLFEKTGILYPKGVLFEDMAVTWSIFYHAKKISKVDEPLYYYILKRKGAITATYSDTMLQMFDSMALVNEYYKKIGAFEEYYDILCFLNMKHTFIRIKDFTNYKNHSLKKKFIDRGLNHLNQYFPDWRDNEKFFKDVYRNKKMMSFFKYSLFWNIFSYIPKSLITLETKLKRTLKLIKKFWKKRNYISRYKYTKMCQKHPIIKRQVLFESYQGATMSDSPFYMMLELLKDTSFTVYYAVKKEIYKDCLERIQQLNLNVKLVNVYSKEYQYVLATSEYLVNNVSFPPYFIRRNHQKYINTWHGTPLKTLGKKMKNGIQDMSNMQRNFLQATTLLYPNTYTFEHMVEDYHLSTLYMNDFLLCGYPRNAIFSDVISRLSIREKYHLRDIEVIAYMPTWRGVTSTAIEVKKQSKEIEHILNVIDEALNRNQVCYVNLHSLLQSEINYESYLHIKEFPKDIDTYQFLNSCDSLITDYSSVFFDFSITEKPIALYIYDLNEYMAQRGTYISLETLPFPLLKTEEDLKLYLKKTDKQSLIENMDEYRRDFLTNDSIKNTIDVNQNFFYSSEISRSNKKKEKQYHLYIMPCIKDPKDEKYLNIASKNPFGIGVFDRADFTPITQKLLSTKYKDNLIYIVMDVRMQLTLKEELKKSLKIQLSSEIFKRELQRILPDVEIVGCTDFKQSYYTRGLANFINKKGNV